MAHDDVLITDHFASAGHDSQGHELDGGRMEAVMKQALPLVSKAASEAKPGMIRQKLIPIYLKMDDELASKGETIACQAGCNYCCHFRVSVTAMEAFALAEYLQARPKADRERLVNQLQATAARVATMDQDEYLRTNVPCAFLDEGLCAVYAVRPAACRGFHSVKVQTCETSFREPDSTVPMTVAPDRQAVSEAYRHVLQAAQYRAGRDATAYEMHAAVVEALTNPTSSKRWKRGKTAFLKVQDKDPIDIPF